MWPLRHGHFNTFQVISGQCLLITEGMIEPLSGLLSYLNITSQAVVWYPARSHYSGNGSTSFYCWITLYVEHLTGELQLPIWNFLFDSAGNRTQDLPDTEWMLYHEATTLVSDTENVLYHKATSASDVKFVTLKLAWINMLRKCLLTSEHEVDQNKTASCSWKNFELKRFNLTKVLTTTGNVRRGPESSLDENYSRINILLIDITNITRGPHGLMR